MKTKVFRLSGKPETEGQKNACRFIGVNPQAYKRCDTFHTVSLKIPHKAVRTGVYSEPFSVS